MAAENNAASEKKTESSESLSSSESFWLMAALGCFLLMLLAGLVNWIAHLLR